MLFFLLLASCSNEETGSSSTSFNLPSSNPSPYQIPFQLNQQVSVKDMENYSWKGYDLISVTYFDRLNEIEYRVAPYPTYKSKECVVQFTIYNQNVDILGMNLSFTKEERIQYFRSMQIDVTQVKEKDGHSFYLNLNNTYYLFSDDNVIITKITPDDIDATWEDSSYYYPSLIPSHVIGDISYD